MYVSCSTYLTHTYPGSWDEGRSCNAAPVKKKSFAKSNKLNYIILHNFYSIEAHPHHCDLLAQIDLDAPILGRFQVLLEPEPTDAAGHIPSIFRHVPSRLPLSLQHCLRYHPRSGHPVGPENGTVELNKKEFE